MSDAPAPQTGDAPALSTGAVVRDGVTLHVTTAGPVDGPPVLLLHGWPDSAELWRHQMPVLAEAGYRVIAPDLRGFGRSDRPAEVEAYRMSESVADVVAILDDAGVPAAHVISHDWGAALGWVLAAHVRDRVISLTAISAGHPKANRAAGMAQMRQSFYMLLFLFEDVGERWLSDDGWARFRDWIGDHPEMDRWIADLSRPGALTASLSWYRANLPPATWVREPRLPSSGVPTLGVIGADDPVLLPAQMSGSGEHVDGTWRYELLDGAGHWPQVEVPDRLSELLLDWLRGPR